MLITRGSWRLEKNKGHSYVQEEQEERSEELRTGHSYLSSWEMMKQTILENISTHVKDKNMIGSSQLGFMKCLTKLIVFCNEVTSLVE